MKKLLLSTAFMLCSCWNVFSQATSLTVDCQMPGWLASYINPAIVQNIRSLTVTGRINSTDLTLIGNLVKNYQLKDRLDLENVEIEGSKLSGEMFGVTGCQLQYFSLPLSVKQLENCVEWVKLDTLVCGSENLPSFNNDAFKYSSYVNDPIYYKYAPKDKFDVKCLILREGVTRYASPAEPPFEEIIFPNSLKYIYELTGNNLSKINIPPYVEHLGPIIGTKLNLNGDTLYIPNSVKYLDDKWGTGGYRNGYLGFQNRDENGKIKCVYLPEELDTLCISQLFGDPYNSSAKVDIHIKAKTPPRVENGTFGSNTKVYVPLGYRDVYKNTGAGTQFGAGQWGGATILEEIYAEEIEINSPDILYVGDSKQLRVNFTPSNTTFKDVTWGVTDNSILSITKEGMCSALGYGEVIISATNADRSCSDSKTIKVYEHTTAVTLDKEYIELGIGETSSLIANTLPLETSDGKISWSSSDELVATIDEKGNITGKGKGTCTITATSVDGGYTATCEVIVILPVAVTGITLNQGTLQFGYIGETYQLEATVLPEDAANKNIKWSSSDPSVCIVSNGMLVTVGMGTSVVIATTEDGGYMAVCIVTVTSATDIASVEQSQEKIFQIYDVSGTKRTHLQKGINIIRYSDGTSKKVLIK